MAIDVHTARDILLSAFDDIGVNMDETTMGASDEEKGINAINRIMAALEADGVDLDFTKLTNITDPLTIQEGAIDALTMLLAYRLWPSYRTPSATPEIINNAISGKAQMYRLGLSISETSYPSTLPTGSGNTVSGNSFDTFYPEASED